MNSDNVFKIPDAELCDCKITEYIKGHSQLSIEVYNPTNQTTITIGFEGVLYIECPVTWVSAAFYKGDDKECIRLLQKVGGYKGISEAHLLERFRLYTVLSPRNGEEIIVKILAHHSSWTPVEMNT